MVGTSLMVKFGQRLPFRFTYCASLAMQMASRPKAYRFEPGRCSDSFSVSLCSRSNPQSPSWRAFGGTLFLRLNTRTSREVGIAYFWHLEDCVYIYIMFEPPNTFFLMLFICYIARHKHVHFGYKQAQHMHSQINESHVNSNAFHYVFPSILYNICL